jgi:hypothetical protein
MTPRCYIGAGQGDESEKTYPSVLEDEYLIKPVGQRGVSRFDGRPDLGVLGRGSCDPGQSLGTLEAEEAPATATRRRPRINIAPPMGPASSGDSFAPAIDATPRRRMHARPSRELPPQHPQYRAKGGCDLWSG